MGESVLTIIKSIMLVNNSTQFIITGEPRSKERPRLNRKTGGVYTPAATVKAEHQVAVAYGDRPPLQGDVAVELVFYCFSKTRRDIDNLVKLVLDGLSGIAYKDDYQVVEISARRIQVGTSKQAETTVRITSSNNNERQKNEDWETIAQAS